MTIHSLIEIVLKNTLYNLLLGNIDLFQILVLFLVFKAATGLTWAATVELLKDDMAGPEDRTSFQVKTGRRRNQRNHQTKAQTTAQNAPPTSRNQVSTSRIPNRLTGTKSANNLAMNTSVVAIPRPLTAFVGRLRENTTAQNLTDWLAESGIHGAQCQKLVAKNGRIYKTALSG